MTRKTEKKINLSIFRSDRIATFLTNTHKAALSGVNIADYIKDIEPYLIDDAVSIYKGINEAKSDMEFFIVRQIENKLYNLIDKTL